MIDRRHSFTAAPTDDDSAQDVRPLHPLLQGGLFGALPAYHVPAIAPSVAVSEPAAVVAPVADASILAPQTGTGLKIAFLHNFTDPDTFQGEAELGLSDGTLVGETVVNINTAAGGSSSPDHIVAFGGNFIFTATDATHGRELFISDGTAGGTQLLKDINTVAPTQSHNGFGAPFQSDQGFDLRIVYNGSLYFSANDGTHGVELWKTDGTTAGTAMAADVFAGSAASNPQYLTAFNNKLYFVASDATHNGNIWSWDGTTATQVTNIPPVAGQDTEFGLPSAFNLVVSGSHLFFTWFDAGPSLGQQLWELDPNSASGATKISDPSANDPRSATNINGTLYFTQSTPAAGYELWKSDGTAAGTTMVANIAPDTNGNVGSSVPYDFTAFNGGVYFVANDGTHGSELWKTDGTAAGTSMVKDIASPSQAVSNPGGNAFFSGAHLTVVGNTLYFAATDGGGFHGLELWKSDGTEAGTVLVKDISPGLGSSLPSELTNINGTLYFLAANPTPDDNNNTSLWKTDGTDAGTVVVANGTGTGFSPFAFIAPAPAVAHDDAFSTTETTMVGTGLNLFLDNGSGADTGASLAVTAVNGVPASVGQQITLGSGAHLTLNANGNFSYDPNHAFDALPAAGSGAVNTVGHDTFTYTLNGGATATVTIAVNGVDSDDTLIGTSGSDTINAGIGNDTITAGGGNDTVDGGSGTNTAVLSGSSANYLFGVLTPGVVTVIDQRAGSPDGHDTYTNVQILKFSDMTDTLTLNGAGHLSGESILFADGSRSVFQYDPEQQAPWQEQATFYDASGALTQHRVITDNNDQWSDTFNVNGYLWDSQHTTGAEIVEQTATLPDGTHTLTVWDTANQFSWHDATLSFDANWNYLSIAGTRDDNSHTIALSEVQTTLDTLLWFATPYDADQGAAVANTLVGGTGADRLYGFAGDDTIGGGNGNDLIVGGTGNDLLTGGTGDDHFLFHAGDGLDTIQDFTPGAGSNDLIDLRSYDLTSFTQVQALMTQSGSDTVITFDASDVLTLHNVTMGALNAGDFVFG